MHHHAAELGAAPELGEHLAGIEQVVGIEGAFHAHLLVEIDLGELLAHQVALLDADTVLAGQHAAHLHAKPQNVGAGYPMDVEGLLIVELDGPQVEVDHLVARVEEIAKERGATTVRVSRDEQERVLFWAGRKAAFPAVGQITPDYMCLDGSVPRGKLVEVLAEMRQMSKKHSLRVVNVFHAGDGNLHPLILFDANDPGELRRAEEFGADILRLCVEVGGVLTGEHGVGIEKRDLMGVQFTEIDLDQQMRVKCAFDPDHLLNPGKVFPQLRRCAELGRVVVHHNKLPFPDIPRF